MAKLDDIMAVAAQVERTVNVCVAGDVSGEYERVTAELDELANAAPSQGRLSGAGRNDRYETLLSELYELTEKMRAATFPFRFRALSPKAWSDLIAAHPSGEGTKLFNPDTFPNAAIAACCVDPEGLGDIDAVNALLEKLSPAQQAELFDAAWEVNMTAPKGLTYSGASENRQDSEKS